MDKKKVKDYLAKAQNALLRYDKAGDKSAFTRAFNLIQDASLELYKSDWVSVEDEPAPRLEWDGSWNDIVVCYKDKWVLPLSYVVRNDIEFTHWRRIEKLEE
jgi:hypothetical protein